MARNRNAPQQHQPLQQPQQHQPVRQPPPPRPGGTFRWWMVTVPATCLIVAWFLSHIRVAFRWSDIMDRLSVTDEERYTQLAMLGIVGVAVALIYRIVKSG